MAASKFTQDIRAALLDAFAAGCSVVDAASSAGVNEETLKGWMTRGRQEPVGDYRDFIEAIDEARAAVPPSPMDADELAVVVSDAARRGNTQAMKLRWDMLRTELDDSGAEDAPVDPLAELDELAARRSART